MPWSGLEELRDRSVPPYRFDGFDDRLGYQLRPVKLNIVARSVCRYDDAVGGHGGEIACERSEGRALAVLVRILSGTVARHDDEGNVTRDPGGGAIRISCSTDAQNPLWRAAASAALRVSGGSLENW